MPLRRPQGGCVLLAGGRPKRRCAECSDVTDLRCPACVGNEGDAERVEAIIERAVRDARR